MKNERSQWSPQYTLTETIKKHHYTSILQLINLSDIVIAYIY
jgi:hypothetical protein